MSQKFECHCFNYRGRIRYDVCIEEGEIKWIEEIKFYSPDDELHECGEADFADHCKSVLENFAKINPKIFGQIYYALNKESQWRQVCIDIKNDMISAFGF